MTPKRDRIAGIIDTRCRGCHRSWTRGRAGSARPSRASSGWFASQMAVRRRRGTGRPTRAITRSSRTASPAAMFAVRRLTVSSNDSVTGIASTSASSARVEDGIEGLRAVRRPLGPAEARRSAPSTSPRRRRACPRSRRAGHADAQTGATSTAASNAAWPAENPNTSTAASGMHAAPEVSRLRPSHPSRIQTVRAGTRSVTRARARISPRSLNTRTAAPSATARAIASAGDSHSTGSGSSAASDGRARPWS